MKEDIDDIAGDASMELFAEILQNALDVGSVSRSRLARIVAKAHPSPLNDAFIKIMDNPMPFYSALRERGLDDRTARHRISELPLRAAGGYGLKPSQFQI